MKELLFKKDPKYYIRRFDYVLQHMRRLLAFDVPNYETLIVKKDSSFIESEKYIIDKHRYYNNRRILKTYGGYIRQELTLRFTTIVKYFELTYNTLYNDSWDEDDTDYEDEDD
jgi:predicted metal-dependent hydrolase